MLAFIGCSPIRQRIGVVFCFIALSLLLFFHRTSIISSGLYEHYAVPRSALLAQQGQFWKLLRADLDKYKPSMTPLTHPENTNLDIGFDASKPRSRPDALSMSKQQLEEVLAQHTAYVEKIRSKQYRLPYNSGTRGIVTTAGGDYLPVALVSIRMLRETGSQLPVEVFLSTWSEWDPVICSTIFPSLNAKCMVLQDVFSYDRKTRKNGLDKYQYKIMAMLFSSFEEILFLDSDCFPIRRANDLFESEPFLSTGLVLFPDFWYPSESPLFFEIAAIQAPKLTARASIEAGEILYSKRKHEMSLLLAAYYNYYGNDFFYPLTSQGAPGEGDKETWLWSAVVMGEPLYTVKTKVKALGYKTMLGEWKGSAMAQFNPIEDNNPNITIQEAAQVNGSAYPRPYFVHANFPKLDPGQIFEPESFGAAGPTTDSNGAKRRIWHANAEDAIKFFGFDLEELVWEVVKEIACQYEKEITSWRDKKDVCRKATDYWNTVFGEG